jgi:hypothetical protein
MSSPSIIRKIASALGFFTAFFCVVITTFARLGETKDQIYKRYGAVVRHSEISSNEWTGDYKTTNYSISVTFSNNISMQEIFIPHHADNGSPRILSGEERLQILNRVAGPGEWIEIEVKYEKGVKMWKNEKTSAEAVQIRDPRDVLSISVAGYSSVRPKVEAAKKTSGL